MASYTYTHSKTGQTATFAQPNPRLEKSDQWERAGKKKTKKKTTSETDES